MMLTAATTEAASGKFPCSISTQRGVSIDPPQLLYSGFLYDLFYLICCFISMGIVVASPLNSTLIQYGAMVAQGRRTSTRRFFCRVIILAEQFWLIDQSQFARFGHGFGAVGHVQFSQDVIDMPFDRSYGYYQLVGNLLIASACGDDAENFSFSLAQAG